MRYMLCRNRVRNYEAWRRIFDSHKSLHLQAGMKLIHIWRTVDDANDLYFLFEVSDYEKANAFVSAPGNEQIAWETGVIEGEIRYLDGLDGY